MVVETVADPGRTMAFPGASVEAKLRSALLGSMKSTASLHGISLPSTTPEQYTASAHLDSLEVVNLLCEIEPIVGFELKDNLVKVGGYHSIGEAIVHLMPRIEAAWQKRQSKGGKK
jgi:hypothetical protein